MIIISPILIILIFMIFISWYMVCKYLIATGIGSRDDETIPIFIAGIIFFIIVAIIVYFGLVFFIRPN
jgi:hypothetical protein